MGGDGEQLSEGLSSAFIRISGGTPRVLHIHSSLVNLTDKRESVEGKREATQMVIQNFLKGELRG